MTGTRRIAAWIGCLIAMAPVACLAQILTVSPSGTITQSTAGTSSISTEDQATKEQLAKLFEVMRIRDQVQSVRKMVPLMVEGQIQAQSKAINAQLSGKSKLTPEQRAAIEDLTKKYVEKAVNIYPAEEMIADMTTIYQQFLTREDVDGMITFYQSPAGQHLLDAQPKIAQQYMPMVMQRVAERSKVLTAEMMKEVAAIAPPAPHTATPAAKK